MIRSKALAILATLALGSSTSEAHSIRLPQADDPRGAFAAVGLDRASLDAIAAGDARARDLFRVNTVGPGERPSLFGTYLVEGDLLLFRPRFPLEAGVTYRATLAPPGLDEPITADLAVPERLVRPSTKVARVSPTAPVLPENLLKFYVEFSAPMRRGGAYEYLSLLDGSGKPIDLPFLELGEELWGTDGRRFTILFDPGRIKSGLRPREEAGPVLEEGKAYTLIISRDWRDAEGAPLTEEFRKPFRVGPADRTPPDASDWKIQAPEAETRAPLTVRFPEPLDRGMLARVIGVAGPDGEGLPGAPAVGEDETSWSFVPEAAWKAGPHRLLIDRSLEDRAGNSIGKPFEVDVFEKVERTTTPKTVALPFTVGVAR